MTAKEVVFSTLDMKETERIPATVFGGGIWTYSQYGEEPANLVKSPERMSELFIEMSGKIKSDIVYVGSGLNNLLLGALGGNVTYKKVGAPEVAPMVDSIEDLEKFDINRIDTDPVLNNIREATRIVAKHIGDEYVVTTTTWGPFILAGQICGVQHLMKAMYKDKDLVKALCDFAVKLLIRFYEPLISDGTIKMISMADSLSSASLISKKHFEELGLPPLKALFSELKSRGVKILLHMCGEMTDRIDLVSTSGCDIISLDKMVDLKKAKEITTGNCVLAGNVSPVDILMSKGKEQVQEAVLQCIEQAAEGGGYMAMPACDLPTQVPIENVITFMETARNYRAT